MEVDVEIGKVAEFELELELDDGTEVLGMVGLGRVEIKGVKRGID